MHCPKCGDVLAERDGAYTCERGDMALTARLAEELRGRFVTRSLPSPQPPRGRLIRVGGEWYCPGCGKRLREEASYIACADCRASLEGLVFAIAQLHPHREWPKSRAGRTD